jgi:hypothetical protein
MPKTPTKQLRKTLAEMLAITLDENLAKVLQSVGQDKTLLAKAKANPKAFLKAQGFTVPARAEVKMDVKKFGRPTTIVPRLTIRICVIYCITLFRGTPFVREHCFEYCRTYFIW